MSNDKTDSRHPEDEMAAEYDFSGGVRGKHTNAVRQGYTMIIHKSDGGTETRTVTPPPGTVVLDPDVRVYFPNSEAVNRALRGLISLVPQPPAQSEMP